MLSRFYEDWTSPELAAADLSRLVPILPIAAIEQHGPHLPLGTDAILARAMVAKVAAEAPSDWPGIFLPVQSIGCSSEHHSFCGTLDFGWRLTTETILAIGESLKRSGFSSLVIVNAHGGNSPMMAQAAVELRARHRLFVATSSWLRFGYPKGLLPPEEIAEGIHGGAVETSLMLHFAGARVRCDLMADFPSQQRVLATRNRHLTAHGRLGFGWMAEDLNAQGVVGDARLASAEIGAAIASYQAQGFLRFVDEVAETHRQIRPSLRHAEASPR
ncbi:MAG: creatininase family protein [Pseudomonadota bacterium]|nr:creatininase family protein [Pseudomonadota bacterium]